MQRIWTLRVQGAEETEASGRRFGELLTAGTFIALRGDLGMGKTVWVRGLARGLGVTGPVTSPTFTLMRAYESGRLPLYHFDAYRVSGADEFAAIGWEEVFYGPGVVAVEWPERVEELLPEGRLELWLQPGETPEERTLTLWQMEVGE